MRLGVRAELVLPANVIFNADLAVKYVMLRARDGVKRSTIESELLTWGKLLRQHNSIRSTLMKDFSVVQLVLDGLRPKRMKAAQLLPPQNNETIKKR